jgi:hypothetical protein
MVLISVLVPEFLLHVSDFADRPRTVVVRGPLLTGFLSALSSVDGIGGWLAGLGARGIPTLSPPGAAEALREAATRRWEELRRAGLPATDNPASFLLTGWGHTPDYGNVAFRYNVTNFEHENEQELGLSGAAVEVTPRFVRYGGDIAASGHTRDRPYSVVLSGFAEHADELRPHYNQITKLLRKNRGSNDVAMACADVVRRAVAAQGGTPGAVLIARMLPDGSVEAGALHGKAVDPVDLAQVS